MQTVNKVRGDFTQCSKSSDLEETLSFPREIPRSGRHDIYPSDTQMRIMATIDVKKITVHNS
jgi:hypothetical protein